MLFLLVARMGIRSCCLIVVRLWLSAAVRGHFHKVYLEKAKHIVRGKYKTFL